MPLAHHVKMIENAEDFQPRRFFLPIQPFNNLSQAGKDRWIVPLSTQ